MKLLRCCPLGVGRYLGILEYQCSVPAAKPQHESFIVVSNTRLRLLLLLFLSQVLVNAQAALVLGSCGDQ